MTLIVLVFGFSCFLLHYGVFVEDLSNVLNIVLRFLFYLTGVFWNIMDRLPAPYNSYIGRGNPIAFLLTASRDCLIYGSNATQKASASVVCYRTYHQYLRCTQDLQK